MLLYHPWGLNPLYAVVSIAALMILITLIQYKYLFPAEIEQQLIANFSTADEKPMEGKQRFGWLHGSVLFPGMMCFAIFLAEGAILDWSAILLRDVEGIGGEFAGAGYAAFSIAMATMRLVGDKVVARLNSRTVVVGGCLLGAVGLAIVISSPWLYGVLAGFILVGLGAANSVPVFSVRLARCPVLPLR